MYWDELFDNGIIMTFMGLFFVIFGLLNIIQKSITIKYKYSSRTKHITGWMVILYGLAFVLFGASWIFVGYLQSQHLNGIMAFDYYLTLQDILKISSIISIMSLLISVTIPNPNSKKLIDFKPEDK
ncbi:MAG: hypothetical protein KJ043_16680 [Anaerolineae bacterium]|nr:hypothetical protein [Anaerolineae bacterium]